MFPVLLLAGCGGTAGPTTTNDFPPPPPSATETQAPAGPIESDGPYGSLGTSSVGPVRFGMSMREVQDKFGKPDKTQEVSFAGPGVDAPQVDWVWEGKDGETRIQFQTSDKTVTGYRTFSTALSTEDGFKIGDPIDDVNKKYGDLLRDGAIGQGTRLLSEGEPGTYPGITFAYNEETGEIVAIEGGMLQPAGD
jgi:hypothetical protein